MIRRLIPLVVLMVSSSAMAQTGIGTRTAASSAQLDVVSSDKGVLFPRVELETLQDYSPIVGERVESLLVYHIGNNTIESGFYYWKSNAWVRLLTGDVVNDRKNNTFTIGANPLKADEESLIITDTKNHSVYLAIQDIAKNDVFVTALTQNQEFITQLTSEEEFITNIINELKEVYGNVVYENNNFYVLKEVDRGIEKRLIDLTTVIQNSGKSLVTDGVIGVTVDGTLGVEAEQAVLKSLILSLNNNKVTSAHIKDGTIQPIDLADAESNQILITGGDKKPIWKDQAKVIPNFFYMPAVIFDTSITGTSTRDLYQDYVNQFTGGSATSANAIPYPISHGPAGTTPISYSGGLVGSTGAPADITVFEKNELYYYITYYDENVFENLSITADGKLNYTVRAGADVSSYMNIVFVIK
ncbi:hypothetical protein [Myroides odoratus]|uniref:hypothetical protein n=1 Tax=Myroides odoratus TaxID=256 RepID=UPI000765B371|nr:hypothetical protein [Myroides odoratus]